MEKAFLNRASYEERFLQRVCSNTVCGARASYDALFLERVFNNTVAGPIMGTRLKANKFWVSIKRATFEEEIFKACDSSIALE